MRIIEQKVRNGLVRMVVDGPAPAQHGRSGAHDRDCTCQRCRSPASLEDLRQDRARYEALAWNAATTEEVRKWNQRASLVDGLIRAEEAKEARRRARDADLSWVQPTLGSEEG